MTLKDITTGLDATCAKLVCLLDNVACNALMTGNSAACTQYEEDRDALETAISNNDRETMHAVLAKYFKIAMQ